MREIMKAWLIRHLNIQYKWGGSDPMEGYDCSGLAQEFLKAFGSHPEYKIDHSAQMLYNVFSKEGSQDYYDVGALAFYGPSKSEINHVAILISSDFIAEAGGGGSRTNTFQDAIAQDAFTRIRPLRFRKDLVGVWMPRNILKLL